MCISSPFVQMSREANIKKYKFFKKHPPKKAFPVLTSEGVIKNICQGLIFDRFRCLPIERSFYNVEIIKESKTRMGVLPKSRNWQKNLQ